LFVVNMLLGQAVQAFAWTTYPLTTSIHSRCPDSSRNA
jgi:hypothetical protein